jgi:hypothetical protein
MLAGADMGSEQSGFTLIELVIAVAINRDDPGMGSYAQHLSTACRN